MKEAMHRLEHVLGLGGVKKDVTLLVIGGISLILSLVGVQPFPFDIAWIAIVLCGIPIILEAIIGLVTAFDIKADLLVSLALIASVCTGEDFAAGEVAFIMQLGALLEDLTVARARAGIEKLVNLTPRTARIVGTGDEHAAPGTAEHAPAASVPVPASVTAAPVDASASVDHAPGIASVDSPASADRAFAPADHASDVVPGTATHAFGSAPADHEHAPAAASAERIVPAEEVQVGDILRVLPGETVPVDGVIVSGSTSINQAVMTGESLPVDKGVGDEVSSGTVNQFGSFEMKATRVGEDSSIQRMIRLVQSADADKAKIVRLADRWATWIVVIALTAAVITFFATGQIIRSVTILVVFCPCALVLATPCAIMAAIGNATRHGFLVREGDALERLARITKVTFDKTGTLTNGTLRVVAVKSVLRRVSDDELYTLAAQAELLSEHPLGCAIVASHREAQGEAPSVDVAAVEQFEMLPGHGVMATCDGRRVVAGNEKLLAREGVALTADVERQGAKYLDEGCTITYIAIDGELAGFLALADTLRPESPGVIARIKDMALTPVLLTGDHLRVAHHIAQTLGIDEVHGDCLPQDKLAYVDGSQKHGQQICMIGDGINDAPALKKAYVGIAMGGVGSDIAVDSADIALVDDEIKELPHLLRLSKRMMVTIRINLTFSLTLNFVAIILAITGILDPVVGALVHNAGSVLVIINSALLLRWRGKGQTAKTTTLSP